ncbi:MAG: S41 family peptidase [Armatimonas sp.]
MTRAFFLFLLGFLGFGLPACAQSSATNTPTSGLLYCPAVSRTQVAFARGNELWVAPRLGGVARSLGIYANEYAMPRFSPDGGRIALQTRIDNCYELATIRVSGGPLKRVTYYPRNGKLLLQWLPNGRLLYATESAFSRVESALFTVPATGGLPQPLPLTYGCDAAYDATGRWLAYVPHYRDAWWRGYQGGAAGELWVLDTRNGKSRRVTSWPGNDTRPMWHGNRLYYLSDQGRERRANLWVWDRTTGQSKQVTHFSNFPIQATSIGPGPSGRGEIVCSNGGDLWALTLENQKLRRIPVTFPGPASVSIPHKIDAARWTMRRVLAPTADRFAIEARGNLWLTDVSGKTLSQLTQTDGIAEREPVWSPDGKHLAYLSDASGESEIHVYDFAANRSRQLTHLGAGGRRQLAWSPSGEHLSFLDHANNLWIVSAANGRGWKIGFGANPVWSPDGRVLVFERSLPSELTRLFAYELSSGKTYPITSGLVDDSLAAFAPDGKTLYYASVRFGQGAVFDLIDRTRTYPDAQVMVAAPFNTRAVSQSAAATESRSMTLPLPGGRFWQLAAIGQGQLLYQRSAIRTAPTTFLFDTNTGKETRRADLDGNFQLAADGDHIFVEGANRFGGVRSGKVEQTVAFEPLPTTLTPRREWRQIFAEIWRLYRDYFYDPAMHGLDWLAIRRHYEPLLERCATREDVNVVIGLMLSELSVGHVLMIDPGDVESLSWQPPGALGADFSWEHGALRFTKLYHGSDTDSLGSGPLRPGSGASVGDYLLRIENKPLVLGTTPWESLVGRVNQPTTLTISRVPNIDATARTITVTPIGSESDLRWRAWAEENRRKVDRLSHGQIGYVYIPDFGSSGIREFYRQYWGQANRAALIVDVRWNSGGSFSDTVIDALNRPLLNGFVQRDTPTAYSVPLRGHRGPKCVLINGVTSSAGENFAYYFRQAKLGKLIGTRTWGGLIGTNDAFPLIDGGSWRIPQAAFFQDSKNWMPEGVGIEPDLTAPIDPSDLWKGEDSQIAVAVHAMLGALRAAPPRSLQAPHPRTRPVVDSTKPRK